MPEYVPDNYDLFREWDAHQEALRIEWRIKEREEEEDEFVSD